MFGPTNALSAELQKVARECMMFSERRGEDGELVPGDAQGCLGHRPVSVDWGVLKRIMSLDLARMNNMVSGTRCKLRQNEPEYPELPDGSAEPTPQEVR